MPNEVDKRIARPLAAERPGHHRDANPEQKSPPSLNKAAAQSDWLQLLFGAGQVGRCALLD